MNVRKNADYCTTWSSRIHIVHTGLSPLSVRCFMQYPYDLTATLVRLLGHVFRHFRNSSGQVLKLLERVYTALDEQKSD